jgi:DDE domain
MPKAKLHGQIPAPDAVLTVLGEAPGARIVDHDCRKPAGSRGSYEYGLDYGLVLIRRGGYWREVNGRGGHCCMCCERALSRQTVVMRTRRPRPATVPRSAFAGFCFPPEVIVLAVRWYLRFGLSFRDVEELLAERGVEVDHVTIYRWVQRFTPLLAEAARPCRHAVGNRWQVDETYVKVAGRWRYVYRAIDQFGQVIDVFVSAQRDGRAARRFFEHAIGTTKAKRWRSLPTSRRCTQPRWKGSYPRFGIAPIGMATTVSKQITAG